MLFVQHKENSLALPPPPHMDGLLWNSARHHNDACCLSRDRIVEMEVVEIAFDWVDKGGFWWA